MSVRRRCQPLRTVVRASVRSRVEQQALGRAYELVLPVIRRVLAEQRSAKTHSTSCPVPQKLMGG